MIPRPPRGCNLTYCFIRLLHQNVSPLRRAQVGAPGVPLRIRTFVFAGGFGNMTGSAECLKVGQVEFSAAAMQRDFVVAFEPPGPAALAAPEAIARKNSAAHPRPSPAVKLRVKPRAAPGQSRETTRANGQNPRVFAK